MKRVILILCFMLLYCAEASAHPFTPKYEAAYIEAAEYWGQPVSQCQSIETHIIPLEKGSDGRYIYGLATIPKPGQIVPVCIYYLAELLGPCELKFTARHEYGHLLGFEHSPDPASVMFHEFQKSLCLDEYTRSKPRRVRKPHRVYRHGSYRLHDARKVRRCLTRKIGTCTYHTCCKCSGSGSITRRKDKKK